MWIRGKSRVNLGEVGRTEIIKDPICLTFFSREEGSLLQ